MTTLSTRRRLLLALAAAAGSGCSLSRPGLAVTTYGIEPAPPARATLRNAATLRLAPVRVASSYGSAELVYRLGEARFASDYYHRLLAPPGAVLGAVIASWLDAAGPMRAVLPPDSAVSARYLLEVNVSQLYGDFRAGQPPAAVLRLHASLLDTAAANLNPMLELAFDEREPLTAATPEALVLAYTAALRRVLEGLQAALAGALR